jgi:hypothetical protein
VVANTKGQEVWWTLGTDCHEERHRFVLVDERCERRGECWVANRRDTIEDAVAKMVLELPEGVRLRVATESDRSLGWVVAQVAGQLGLEIWHVPPKAQDRFREAEGLPRKDDDIDAFLSARMVWLGLRGCRIIYDPQPDERALCRLTRLRFRQVTRRRAVQAQLRSLFLEVAPEVLSSEWEGPMFGGQGMRAVLRRWPVFRGLERAHATTVEKVLRSNSRYGDRCTGMVNPLKEMARRVHLSEEERAVIEMAVRMALDELELLDKAITELSREIARQVEAHPIGKKLLAMPGVGPVTAATDIAELLPVARHVSEGKAATYAGLTPVSRRSGKPQADGKGPSRLARGVNKHALRTNYLSAVSAIQASAIDAAYHRKQKARHQGHPKPHVKATIALARQRFKVKYKLMTTDAVYDKETLIASHLERLESEKAGPPAA